MATPNECCVSVRRSHLMCTTILVAECILISQKEKLSSPLRSSKLHSIRGEQMRRKLFSTGLYG